MATLKEKNEAAKAKALAAGGLVECDNYGNMWSRRGVRIHADCDASRRVHSAEVRNRFIRDYCRKITASEIETIRAQVSRRLDRWARLANQAIARKDFRTASLCCDRAVYTQNPLENPEHGLYMIR